MNDYDLLRRFEPVICYTQGEGFFPCAVDGYVRRCSLCLVDDKGNEQELVAAGDLTAERLAQYKDVPSRHNLYLRFVSRPLLVGDYLPWRHRPDRPSFKAPGRLARVSWYARIMDLLFNVSLVIRGVVPGGTAAGADMLYRDMRKEDPRDVYYGRVVRDGGYVILHYMFFYAMNDWRSGFYGVNDHEGDWEQLFIYLSDEGDDRLVPSWVASSSHDLSGDDLRRRWDDPDLQKWDEDHVVFFAAAGSHSGYFYAGEYMMNIEPAFLGPIKKGINAVRRLSVEKFGQGDIEGLDRQASALLSVPFIDYARGDGVSIGPGQPREWTTIPLTEETGWVEDYRGLWGLDTRDFMGGERAPAGPMYNQDGSVRQTWYDPLGWAGLNKVPPPGMTADTLRVAIAALQKERDITRQELAEKREAVRSLALAVQSLQAAAYLKPIHKAQSADLAAEQEQLQATWRRCTELDERIAATQSHLARIEIGDWGDPRAHIRHEHRPEPPTQNRGRFVEYWGALSAGLLLLTFTGLVVWDFPRWWIWVLLTAGIYVFMEAILHRRLAGLLPKVTVVLAVVTAVLLIIDFWQLVIILIVAGIVITMIAENVRELRRT